MFFTCYEVSKSPIDSEDYLTQDSAVDYLDKYGFDFCMDEDVDDRPENVKGFQKLFAEGLFTQFGENSFRYNGGFEAWEKEYIRDLKRMAAELPEEGILKHNGLYQLKQKIENPLGEVLFYFGDSFPTMYLADKFMRSFVSQLYVGDIIYIGGIVMFHY